MANKQGLLQRFKLQEYPQPDIMKTRHPLLLCHGFGAIGSLVKPSPLHDPCILMRERGIHAFAPNIVPYASIETRAKSWVRIIDELCSQYNYEKLNVIAHSMGGLDMRHAIAHLGIADKVASLTTVASPHYGTYLADLVLKTPELLTDRISEVVDWFGNNVYPDERSNAIGSVEQLTIKYVTEEFNPATPDNNDLPYFSYSAAVGKGTDVSLNPIFKFQNLQIYDKQGINDSFVSEKSARWGTFVGCIPLSHLNQINVQVSKENRIVYQEFWLDVVRNLIKNDL